LLADELIIVPERTHLKMKGTIETGFFNETMVLRTTQTISYNGFVRECILQRKASALLRPIISKGTTFQRLAVVNHGFEGAQMNVCHPFIIRM